MPVLEDVLQRFATERGQSWHAYDAIPGLVWHRPAPVETSEAIDLSARYARSGALLLDGFDDTLLPDLEDDAHEGNEGESGITLSGDADRIHDIAVVKFYPSEDYLGILSRQFASPRSVDTFALAADDVHSRIDMRFTVYTCMASRCSTPKPSSTRRAVAAVRDPPLPFFTQANRVNGLRRCDVVRFSQH